MKIMLKTRMYLQFSAAALPLVLVLLYQLLSTSDLPLQVDRMLANYDLALQASAGYKNFLNGVSDAVDTGKLGDKPLQALADARLNADKLNKEQASPSSESAAATLAKIQAAVGANNSLATLLPLKADINGADTALASATADIKTRLSRIVAEDSQQTRQRGLWQSGIAGVTLLLLAFIIRQMVNGITRPIAAAVRTAQRVAQGDLTTKITVERHDEIGALQQALLDMDQALSVIVSDVRGGTDVIASASQQISAGNLDLSARTEAQASSLEQTASSMEQLTSTVRQNAEHARRANDLAVSASAVALKGGSVVAEVVATMGSINDSSKKIVDIIGVIDGIAFQTNILALNAAVEAARAGEQGRGFAVVATEVRNLAQRSAAAAKEIKTLIDDSVEQVGVGGKLVDQAGATMREIVASIGRVTDIMGDISAASQEQSAGLEHVKQAINHMDQSTQQNAALTEQAASAAGALHEQAERLSQVVGVFKLNGMHAPAPAAPVPAAPVPAAPRQRAAPARIGGARPGADRTDEWETF